MSAPEALRIVLFFDSQVQMWVGQCLEYDIVVQASDWMKAISEMKLAIVQQAELDDHFETTPLSGCPPAPEEYVKLFNNDTTGLVPTVIVNDIPTKASGKFVERFLGHLTVKQTKRQEEPASA